MARANGAEVYYYGLVSVIPSRGNVSDADRTRGFRMKALPWVTIAFKRGTQDVSYTKARRIISRLRGQKVLVLGGVE